MVMAQCCQNLQRLRDNKQFPDFHADFLFDEVKAKSWTNMVTLQIAKVVWQHNLVFPPSNILKLVENE